MSPNDGSVAPPAARTEAGREPADDQRQAPTRPPAIGQDGKPMRRPKPPTGQQPQGKPQQQVERRQRPGMPPAGLPERRQQAPNNPTLDQRKSDKGPPPGVPDRRQQRPQQRPQVRNMKEAQAARPEARGNAQQTGRIRDLEFVDLYVPLHAEGIARYNVKSARLGEPSNVPVTEAFESDLANLRGHLNQIEKADFSVVHDKVRYRGSRAQLASGENWVCLRRISDQVPTLEQLNVDPLLIPAIRDIGHRTGLVIVCGGTGQGKSTTANAILADYLDRIGNVAMTIEDPVEFNLAGERGNGGYCFQVEVDGDDEWADALKRALRWHPRFMLVGEIRSGAAAAQVLRAATSGHLVITTFHAGSVEKGIQSIIQVAEMEIGQRAQELVAEGLTAAFHQTLTRKGPELQFLFTEAQGSDPARNYIRSGKMHMLASFMEQQATRISVEAQTKTKKQQMLDSRRGLGAEGEDVQGGESG